MQLPRPLPRLGVRKACGSLAALLALYVLVYSAGLLGEGVQAPPQLGQALVGGGGGYDRRAPLIFIGGVPRSGTTLMRAMLDAHKDIRCGQETRVIPRLLQMRFHWLKSEKESMRLEQAGITKEVLDSAIAAFTLEIIAKHGAPAARLCNKDPLTIKMGTYVVELFPNAKFVFMVRDGRATAHSIISRKVTITGFDLTSYRQCLKKWNSAVEAMNNQCKELGPHRCLRVPYEQLVLHPKQWMEKVLDFLDIPWDDAVLHHEDFINNGIELSKIPTDCAIVNCVIEQHNDKSTAFYLQYYRLCHFDYIKNIICEKQFVPDVYDYYGNLVIRDKVERSSDQVIKPVNLEALSKWVGHIPDDVVRDMAEIAPMLSVLGYDPYANPPEYGRPDERVAHKTKEIQANRHVWERKAKEMFSAGWDNGDADAALDKEPSDAPSVT